jgi:predicted SAM-dependent methyltransferase
MKINIGSGYNKIRDYVTIDHDVLTNPDFVIDLEKEKLPFNDNTVNAVRASHVLEHLGDGYFHCLQELYRVCENKAIIDIYVPHPRHDDFISDPTHKRPITVDGLHLFSKKYNMECRKGGWAHSCLGDYYDVDFEINKWEYFLDKKFLRVYDSLSQQQIENYYYHCNNVISEIYIQLMVIK